MGKKNRKSSQDKPSEEENGETVDGSELYARFAKKLASNEPRIRTRAMTLLSKYLQRPESANLPDIDFLLLWKGLFYSLWMADKVPLQREIAERSVGFAAEIAASSGRRAFLACSLEMLRREWDGIDHYRMDKFYYLLRLIVRTVLQLGLQSTQKERREMLSIISKVLSSDCPGISYHVVEVYVSEVREVLGIPAGDDKVTQLERRVGRALFRPLLSCVFSDDNVLYRKVRDCIEEMIAIFAFDEHDVEEIADLLLAIAGNEDLIERRRRDVYRFRASILGRPLLSLGKRASKVTDTPVVIPPEEFVCAEEASDADEDDLIIFRSPMAIPFESLTKEEFENPPAEVVSARTERKRFGAMMLADFVESDSPAKREKLSSGDSEDVEWVLPGFEIAPSDEADLEFFETPKGKMVAQEPSSGKKAAKLGKVQNVFSTPQGEPVRDSKPGTLIPSSRSISGHEDNQDNLVEERSRVAECDEKISVEEKGVSSAGEFRKPSADLPEIPVVASVNETPARARKAVPVATPVRQSSRSRRAPDKFSPSVQAP